MVVYEVHFAETELEELGFLLWRNMPSMIAVIVGALVICLEIVCKGRFIITAVEGDTLGVSAEGQIGRVLINIRVHVDIVMVRTATGTCRNGVTKPLWLASN